MSPFQPETYARGGGTNGRATAIAYFYTEHSKVAQSVSLHNMTNESHPVILGSLGV